MRKLLLITTILFGLKLDAQTQLWGLTSGMGVGNTIYSAGNIFKVDSSGANQTVEYNFNNFGNGSAPQYSHLTEAVDGKLYGLAIGGAYGNGILFQYDPLVNSYSKKIDFISPNGNNPLGSLVQAS